MNIQTIKSLISSKTQYHPKRSAAGFIARCPAHDDKNPSLSIIEASDGKILLKCFAGCSTEEICNAIGIQVSDLFPKTEKNYQKKENPNNYIAYQYEDENGNVIYEKVRIESNNNEREKRFYFRRKDEKGNIIKGKPEGKNLLYKISKIKQAIAQNKPVYLVEGEKDVDTLLSHGLFATTSEITPISPNQWKQEYTLLLKDADVVILYDYDKTGFKRRDLLGNALHGKVKSLKVVDLPGLECKDFHGEDISDWLEKGNTAQQLVDITNKTPLHVPTQQTTHSKVQIISMEELLEMELPEREMLLAPFLPTQGLALLHAKRGVGKTLVALGISYAVAGGGSFFVWEAPAAKRVLYIDGEMPAVLLQERLSNIFHLNTTSKPHENFLDFITPDLQEESMPNLLTREGRDAITEIAKNYDLVVVDNLSTLCNGEENEAESWIPIQVWALGLRKHGKSVLFVHHTGKSGKQRGTSKREDVLDTVIKLEHPEGYNPGQGALFEVHFEKARGFCGQNASPFQAHLEETSDGKQIWTISEVQAKIELSTIAQMRNENKKIMQIVEETKLTKSQVETRIKKAREAGLLT